MGYNSDSDYVLLTEDEILDELRKRVNAKMGCTFTLEKFKASNWYVLCYPIVQSVLDTESNFLYMKHDFSRVLENLNDNFVPAASPAGIQKDFYDATGHIVSFAPVEKAADAGRINAAIDILKTDANFNEVAKKFCEIMADRCYWNYFARNESKSVVQSSRRVMIDNTTYKTVYFYLMKKYDLQLDYQIKVFVDTQGYIVPLEDMQDRIMANIEKTYYAGAWEFAPLSFIEPMYGRTFGDTCTVTVKKITDGNGKETTPESETYKINEESPLLELADYMTNLTIDKITVEYVLA